MKAVKVRKEIAEKVRKELEKSGVKDRSRRIRFENGYVIIPVKKDFGSFSAEYEIIEDRNPVFKDKKNFREIVESIAGSYPRNADLKIFGDVGLMKLPSSIFEYRNKIAHEVLKNYRLNSIWLDRGRYGMERKPEIIPLIGKKSLVEVKENGCIFRFDLTKVMFSQGNQFEKMRIARLVERNEIVIDMFAGIGYFTVPLMKHSEAKKCYAIELNPVSYGFLLENIKLNGLKNVIPVLGDSMNLIPENFADRVIMGHIKCEEFLETAINALNEEGWIHYHEATPEKVIGRPLERVKKQAEAMNTKILEISMRKVKSYSPKVYHVVVDARIRKN